MSMTENRYREIIEAFGADEKRWPENERQDMRAFQGAHPKQASMMRLRESALDNALSSAAKPKMDNSLLIARISKQAESLHQSGAAANDMTAPEPQTRRGAPPWKSLAATLMISTGLGFGFGQAAATPSDIAQAQALFAASANAQYDYDWMEEGP